MKRIPFAVLSICVIFWAGFAFAQDAPTSTKELVEGEPAPPEIVEPSEVVEGRELLQQLDGALARIKTLEKLAQDAEGEDLGALELQIMDAKIKGLDVVHQLAANVLAQEAAGLDAAEIRARIEGLLTNLLPAVVKNLEIANDDLTQMRKSREQAAPSDVQAYELRISRASTWLNTLFSVYAELIYQYRNIGLDDTAALDDLTTRLVHRADLLEGRVGLVTQQLAERKKQALDNPDDATHSTMIQALKTRKQTATGSLSELTGLMDRFEIDSSKYRQLLITSTGEVTTDVFRKTVFVGLLTDGLAAVSDWAKARGPAIGFKVIVFFLILASFSVLSRLVRFIVSRRPGKKKSRKSRLVQNMLEALAGRVVMMIGFLVALSTLGFQIGPLLTGLGIVGFIVGFALQDSLSNFAAGVMILGYRPYDLDDFIETGGVFGKVSDMSLVSTTILTIDNQTMIVPNAKIWGDVIKNITHQNRRRVDMKFRIAYTDDVDLAERILMEIITSHDKVLEDPAPAVRLHELGEFAMEIVVRPWVATADYWDVYWDVTREVKRKFDAAGLTIPLPQRVVHMRRID